MRGQAENEDLSVLQAAQFPPDDYMQFLQLSFKPKNPKPAAPDHRFFAFHVEVMSDKKEADYMKIIKHLEIEPSELLMVGNSLRSDVLPLLAIGAAAVHVPYHTTWMHEQVSESEDPKEFYKTLHQLVELKNYFS